MRKILRILGMTHGDLIIHDNEMFFPLHAWHDGFPEDSIFEIMNLPAYVIANDSPFNKKRG